MSIAIKAPLHKRAETVAYDRDRLGLQLAKQLTESTGLTFSDPTPWTFRVERQSQRDLWLKLITDAAMTHLVSPQRDQLAPLDGPHQAVGVLLVRRE